VKAPKHRNVTLSLPEHLLRRFRIYAATRNQSMTGLMAESIRRMMDQIRTRIGPHAVSGSESRTLRIEALAG